MNKHLTVMSIRYHKDLPFDPGRKDSDSGDLRTGATREKMEPNCYLAQKAGAMFKTNAGDVTAGI
jgi:hypothetical protein